MLRPRRLLPLTAVVGLSFLPGCPELIGLLCDFETDETCIDSTRAQIRGNVRVPEASNASTSLTARAGLNDADLPALKDIARQMLAVKVDGSGAPVGNTGATVDVDGRQRVPKAGPWKSGEVTKHPGERWREGEIIVRAHEAIRGKKAQTARALEAFLGPDYRVNIRLCGTEFRCLVDVTTVDGKKTDLETTARLARKLAQLPSVKYAEKNLILDKSAVFPSDEFFTFQWHYAAIDVPAAWDVTVGSPDVVAAVIDTGILVDHPDLASRIVGGADLIDDPGTANDGDGRDDDGDDAGDNSCGAGCHSHHGSHCAGTMGAVSDNGLMVSGITWAGGLLAVRVLGDGGGSLADIADGIEWAVGNPVDGVTTNSRPADVLNMSLGGAGESAAMNEAIQDAVDSGAIVLVAAGNDNRDAADFTPANAPGAITVSAVGYNFGATPERASYSNFGSLVDVAAPGGEQRDDSDGDGNGDGVLSTIGDFVGFYQGTSMATPHVAGVAMLMKSQNPNLTQDEAKAILQDTADADIVCPEGCGAGQINAFAAVVAAGGGAVDGLSAASVRVGKGVTTASIVIRNFGDAAVTTDFSVGGSNRDAVTIDPTSANIPAKGKVTVTATITRNADADDNGAATVRATAGAETAEARIDWTADTAAVVQEVRVMPVLIADGGFDPVFERLQTTTSLDGFSYNLFNLAPGTYLVFGVLDGNDDDDFDDAEDALGVLTRAAVGDEVCPGGACARITVAAGDVLEGQDFLLAPGFTGGDDVGGNGDGVVGDACGGNGDCDAGLFCEGEAFAGGYCTASCVDVASDCPAGSTCFDVGGGDQICFADCAVDSDCARDGYICDFVDGIGSCIPG
jgi:serine protease